MHIGGLKPGLQNHELRKYAFTRKSGYGDKLDTAMRSPRFFPSLERSSILLHATTHNAPNIPRERRARKVAPKQL